MNVDRRFDNAIPDALRLVDVVHGNGSADDVAHALQTADVPAVLVVLAALVPDDQTVNQLLAWNRPLHSTSRTNTTWSIARRTVPVTPEIRALHAEHRRLRDSGQPVPQHVADGERAYQQVKKRGQRAKAAA
jgi:hypothetical protein